MESLNTRIKTTRVSLGLSQAILAEKTGVSQPTVANWENGSHIPRQAVLEKISEALSVSTNWLISGNRAANEIPSQIYLQTPIRHIPVFEWPDNPSQLSSAAPSGFIPYSSRMDDLIGLLARQAKSYTVTLFRPQQITDHADGEFLVSSDHHIEQMSAQNIGDEKILGKVVAEMKFYP